MWFTLGFAAGSIPWAYLLWDNLFLVAGALSLVLAVILCLLNTKAAKIAATVIFGFAFSVAWFWGYDAMYLGTARSYDAQTETLTVEISDYSYETDYGITADGKVRLDGKSYNIRIYLGKMDQLCPGDSVTGAFRLRITVNGGQEEATYHQGKGIFLLGYARGQIEAVRVDRVPGKYFAAKLRRDITNTLDSVFPADTAGFAKALLLGDSTGLTYEQDTAFKVSGIRHVIAVSGLHVSILFAMVYLLAGKRRVMTALLGIPVLLLFAAVAGFTPSVVRACVMQLLMILALLFNKEYDPPTALAFSVLLMLLVNPLTITSVSFQLSVGCMIGIFLFCQKTNNYLMRLIGAPAGKDFRGDLCRWLTGGISVTFSAMAVTTPLSILYFGTVSIGGVITNLLTLWVISFIFYGIMLSCLLGAVWLPLGSTVAWVVSWPVRYVLTVAKAIAAVPLASVYTCSLYILLWVALCYILFSVFLLSKKKRPVLLVACMLVGFVMCVAASWIEPRLDAMRVTVIDVGQGQSVLLQSKGKYYLVDCGGDNAEITADTVSELLLSQGIFRLDGVIVTHYDADHAGGIGYLLSRVETDTLYLPDIADDGNLKDGFSQEYAEEVQWIESLHILSGAWGKLTMIPGDKEGDENESSLCILFHAENCDILITGDRGSAGEKALLDSFDLPELELLVAGHHGAPGSTTIPLISKTQPKAVAISVGEDNAYGHPSGDVLERLELFGCNIFRTDEDGTLIFRR